MMAAVRDDYLMALYSVSKTDPAKWATFLEAFKTYTVYELERSLGTPTGDIAVAFGHSRCITRLRDDFIEIEQLADKIKR
jgi:hypothetical protein